MLSLIRTIGLVVITAVATVFFIQNLATIEVAFLTWSIAAPRAVIFLMVFGTGLIAGYLLHALRPQLQRAPHETRGNIISEKSRSDAPNIRE